MDDVFILRQMKILIEKAGKHQALTIARLIMQAMNYDCCKNFLGPDYTLDDFERVMTQLVLADDSQYSYRNTLVALGENGCFLGMCVSYDGAQLHALRRAFVDAMQSNFHHDFSQMADETAAGELYIDSLAVPEEYRGKGVASALLKAMIEKGRQMGLPAAGLLVDKGNPMAEKLYTKLGFEYINDATWGGHDMRHMQYVFSRK